MSNAQDHDNEPYADDFSESDAAYNDTSAQDVSDDTWVEDEYEGEFQEDGVTEENQSQDTTNMRSKKKKSGLVTLLIIVVVVIAGLGGLVMMFGGEKSAPTPQTLEESAVTDEGNANTPQNLASTTTEENTVATNGATQLAPNPTPDTAPITNVVDASQDGQGFMLAPEKVENIVIKKPVTIEEKEPSPPAEALETENANTANSAPTEIPSEFPTVANILKPEPDTVAEPPPEQPQNTATESNPIPSPEPSISADTLKTLQSNLDQALAKITELEDRLEKQAAVTSQNQDTPPVMVEELQNRIVNLESQLKSRNTKKPSAVSQPSKTSRVKSYEKWQLRSASTGRAIVYNPSTQESVSLQIGDKLSSIGRVITIEKTPSGWIVYGTLGKITQ